MEVDQGPNWSCSAKGKEFFLSHTIAWNVTPVIVRHNVVRGNLSKGEPNVRNVNNVCVRGLQSLCEI
jgi:hypothetical protein